MSNNIYEQGLYNEDLKTMYLKDLPLNTYTAYARILKRVRILEEQLAKDLYNFNLYEIEQLLHYLAPKSLNSSQQSGSIIQSYIRWSIAQGLRSGNINPLDAVGGSQFYHKFVDRSSKLVFSKEEIDNVTGSLINYPDAAVIRLIFEGVMGKGYSELLNLTIHDISADRQELALTNDLSHTHKEKRVLQLDPKEGLIPLLIKAYEQQIYYKNNGNPAPNNKAPSVELVNNSYVLRSAALNTKYEGRADSYLIIRRLKLAAVINGQPYLSAMNIRNSGMLYMAYKLYVHSGRLGKEEIDTVCEHFNLNKLKNGKDFNVTRLKSDFLNLDMIRNLYLGEG